VLDGVEVQFRLLGPVEVRVGNRLVDVGAARQRCVLAALVMDANRSVAVDDLVERVWGGSRFPERPRRAAQTYVSLLRTALADIGWVSIVRRPGSYVIELDERFVDVHEFRRLAAQAQARSGDDGAAELWERALGLWRGEAFGPLDTLWFAAVRVRLNQERQAVERDLTDLQLRQGRHGILVARLSAWAREDPLEERLAGQLMLALFRSGRQADALSHYQRVRERLAAELGTDPARELQELHRRILTDDPALTAESTTETGTLSEPTAATATTPSPVPRQLPGAPRWFIGRRTELDTLLRHCDHLPSAVSAGGVVVISAIDGMAGVGKTALALHAAHRLAERFTDGQLFIDLRGHTQGHQPRSAAEALEWILLALGVPPQRIPQDADERAALYRQRLAGTRTLIVLDNAANEAQIRPLLPGDAGCLVLVTSRRRLKGLDDASTLSLDVLPQADAVALLRSVATRGHEDELMPDPLLAEIADLCGRLPLALRIAAALLRHRPAWSPEHLAALLRDQHQRLGTLFDGDRNLTAVFDLSYQNLGATHQRLFRRLGLLPGPDVDAYAAAALADTHPSTATGLLEVLVDHNLLMQHTPGRYWMHDLLRLYARTLADRDPAHSRDSALERLLNYYQHTAIRADDLVTRFPWSVPTGPASTDEPDLADADAAWTWLRTERPNLLAALNHTGVHALPERTIALTAGLATLLRTDGTWSQAITLHTAAVAIARDLGDRTHQAHALIQLGEVRGATGDYPGAERDLHEALNLFRDLGVRRGQAQALTLLGHRHGLAGDYPGARRDLQEAVGLYRSLDDRRGQSHALTLLGQGRGLAGDYPGAARDLQEALGLCRGRGDRRGQAYCLVELAYVRQATGDYPGAVRDLHEALGMCGDLDDPRAQANALTLLGDVRRLTGDYPGATRDLREALELYERLGDRLGQANVRTLRARVRGATGDHQGAIPELRAAVDLFRRIGARGNETWALNHYAAVVAATGDHLQALTLYRDALLLARETHQPDDEARALEGLGECHLNSGDTEAGVVHLKQSLDAFQRIALTPDAHRVQQRLSRLAPTRQDESRG
jgi:DNA-binding SARP family transcriptional activator